MNASDRSTLGLLAAAAALVLWASMSGERTEFGLPNLFGTGRKDRGGRVSARKGTRPSSTSMPGTQSGGKGSPYIEVTGPRIVGPGEQ